MIVNNSPLGFTKASDGCDCRDNSFSLPIALSDNAKFQIDISCEEITGTNTKLPCEENQIGPYTEDLRRYNSINTTPEPLLIEYLISSTDIRFTEFQDSGNLFSTEVGFLEANRCYWLRYTVSGYQEGWVQSVQSVSESERTTGPNPARRANGTYSEIFCTDADGRLVFQVGPDDDPDDIATLILSNVFIGCIRYSELYDISNNEVDDGLITYGSQTKICKEETTDPVFVVLRANPFIFGQIYKICFNLEGSTQGSIDLMLNTLGPHNFAGNGFHCIELEYEDDTYVTLLTFELGNTFNGCISDISIYLVPGYHIGLFDSDNNEVEGALDVEEIENTLKVSINPSTDTGCYRIGISDNCSNFMNQFYGNILKEPVYSEFLDFPSQGRYYPISVAGGVFSLQFAGWADLANDVYDFTHYFIIRDSICYQKLYDALFEITLTGNGNTFNSVSINVHPAGEFYASTIPTPGPTETITFIDIISGTSETDDCSNIGSDSPVLCALIGKNGLFVEITTQIVKSSDTPPVVQFNDFDSNFLMDQEPGQFCPEYYSVPLNVSALPDCDTILVKYRNPQNAFDFDYRSPGYLESDGFYNQLRIPGKLWKPSNPKTKFIQKNSTGRRDNYYSDVDKKMVLTTGLLPEPIHDALALALEHEVLIIDGVELVCESEEYAPPWDKSSELASVEVELFVQQSRKLNTKC